MSPTLLWIVGPPAVGKMTVGEAIAERTGLKVFCRRTPPRWPGTANHLPPEQVADPVVRHFELG